MRKLTNLFLVFLLGFIFSCTDDDTISPAIETSTEVQKIITKKLPFEQTPHYLKAKPIITQMSQNLNHSAIQNKGNEAAETFEILIDEVIYMEYDDSHSYTFKVRRSNPEYYIENVVLHYNPETKEYV